MVHLLGSSPELRPHHRTELRRREKPLCVDQQQPAAMSGFHRHRPAHQGPGAGGAPAAAESGGGSDGRQFGSSRRDQQRERLQRQEIPLTITGLSQNASGPSAS